MIVKNGRWRTSPRHTISFTHIECDLDIWVWKGLFLPMRHAPAGSISAYRHVHQSTDDKLPSPEQKNDPMVPIDTENLGESWKCMRKFERQIQPTDKKMQDVGTRHLNIEPNIELVRKFFFEVQVKVPYSYHNRVVVYFASSLYHIEVVLWETTVARQTSHKIQNQTKH